MSVHVLDAHMRVHSFARTVHDSGCVMLTGCVVLVLRCVASSVEDWRRWSTGRRRATEALRAGAVLRSLSIALSGHRLRTPLPSKSVRQHL